MRVLVVSSMGSSRQNPHFGHFINTQVDLLQRKGITCQLVANSDNRRGLFNVLRKYILLTFQVLHATMVHDWDLVHAHSAIAECIAMFAASLRRVPLVLTVHGMDDVGVFVAPSLLYKYPWLTKWIAKTCLRRADHIIAVSEYLRNILVHELGISEHKISVIDMGVNTSLFRMTEKSAARKQLGLSPEDKLLLYVGRLHPAKGVSYLLEAMALIGNPNYLVVIVGDGEEKDRLEDLCTRLGIRATFVGAVPHEQIPLWMSASDLLVHPTLSEGFGLVVLESFSCGLPVVASDVGAIPEQIQDGLTGYLVKPGDRSALAEGICRGMETLGGHRDDLRRVALQHDINVQVDRVIAAYCSLVGQ